MHLPKKYSQPSKLGEILRGLSAEKHRGRTACSGRVQPCVSSASRSARRATVDRVYSPTTTIFNYISYSAHASLPLTAPFHFPLLVLWVCFDLVDLPQTPCSSLDVVFTSPCTYIKVQLQVKMTKGGNIRHGTPTIPSSPPQAPAVSPRSKKSTKPRKPPPITPKRFTRFFTPRSSSSIQSRSKSSRQLRDITKSAVNRSSSQLRLKPPFSVQSIDENGNLSAASTPGLTPPKRKLDLTPPTSPIPHSSPSKRPRIDGVNVSRPEIPSSPPPLPVLEEEGETSFAADNYDISEPNFSSEITFCQPIKRLRMSNTSLRILERSFGGLETQRRGFRTDSCIGMYISSALSLHLTLLGNDYATRDFYSSEKDVHRHVRKGVPFAAAACHTNSLIAVATESGRIHIIDSDKSSAFEECHIMMRPLENAVTDLEFSADDSMLAIGCGDKSMRLIDMQSQRVKMVFKDHWGCIKQVRFRPGDPHVIATCCREGIVNLWDSRCRGEMRPVFTEIVHGDTRLGATSVKVEYKAEYQSNPNRSWPRAHSDRLNMKLLNDGPKGFR